MTATAPAATSFTRGYFFDKQKAGDWSMTGAAIKVSVAAALVFMIVGIAPLLTAVHGQPETELDREVSRLNRRIDQLDGIPSQISLILEHQRLRDAEEDERELRHESFETKELYGQLGAFGAMMMVIFGAFVHWWTGFTPIRPLDRKRSQS